MSVIEMIGLVPSDNGTVEVAMLVDGHRMGKLFGSVEDLRQYCESADVAKSDDMDLAILQWHALDPSFKKSAVTGKQMTIERATLAKAVIVADKEASEVEVKP